MSTTNIKDILAQAQTLSADDRWTLVEDLLALMKGVAPKAEKAKAQRKPRGPVSDDSFIHFSNSIVLPMLKALAEGREEAEQKQMRGVSGKAGVAAALWAKLKDLPSEARIEAMAEVTEEQVAEAYETWKATPKDSDSGSVKSKASKAELSDEEKAAKKAAANEKRKATRAANKAAKATESATESEPEKPKEEPKAEKPVEKSEAKPKKVTKPKVKVAGPEFSEDQISWCDDKGREYLVLEHNMWDATTTKWVGKWDAKTNKIDTTAKEPALEED
jgi:hypothetical protein